MDILRLKEIEDAIGKIQKNVDKMGESIQHADEFVVMTDFSNCMNDMEIAFHEVRKVSERLMENINHKG